MNEPRRTELVREKVLTELASISFLDKRTDAEAWDAALRQAQWLKLILERAHEKLKELGVARGVLDLEPFLRQSGCPAHDSRCTEQYCILDPRHPQRRP